MMDLFSIFKLTPRMTTILHHWRRWTMLHWLLVDRAQILIRLRHLTYQPILGLKLQVILIMISKLPIFSFLTKISKYLWICYSNNKPRSTVYWWISWCWGRYSCLLQHCRLDQNGWLTINSNASSFYNQWR